MNGYSEADPDKYLTHTSLPVDFKVSFTAEDVVNGDDTVVKEALKWINSNIIISVDKHIVNKKFHLYQNFPNPFNPSTTIKYSIPVGANNYSPVQLKIYDMLGQEVAILVNEQQTAGNYEVKFDASAFSSGVYFYRLQAGEFVSVKKLMLLK